MDPFAIGTTTDSPFLLTVLSTVSSVATFGMKSIYQQAQSQKGFLQDGSWPTVGCNRKVSLITAAAYERVGISLYVCQGKSD
jgi:hypothetical protein